MLQVTASVVSVWGAERVGARFGPNSQFNAMSDSNPDDAAEELKKLGIAYPRLIEPRIKGYPFFQQPKGAHAA